MLLDWFSTKHIDEIRGLDRRRAVAALPAVGRGPVDRKVGGKGDEDARSNIFSHQRFRCRTPAESLPEGVLRQPHRVGVEGSRISGAVCASGHAKIPRLHGHRIGRAHIGTLLRAGTESDQNCQFRTQMGSRAWISATFLTCHGSCGASRAWHERCKYRAVGY